MKCVRILGLLLSLLTLPGIAPAYSVLTHQAIVDTVWQEGMVPVLRHRFPDATEEGLREAHAHAYGGCILQDAGYYPFSNHLFSDLTHYVRSADFVQALVDEATNLNELAFALGAVSHYHADLEGHSIAVNRSVALLYPKLQRRFGNLVTYGDSPVAHLKTEFGFDVLQVARGHYAPQAYHDFVGFKTSKDLLERAFLKTYALKLKDLFFSVDLALGSYRYAVSSLIPDVTKVAWSLKGQEILTHDPKASRQLFIYRIKRASFEKEWGHQYERPGVGARLLAALLRLMPKFGLFRSLDFRPPTPPTERLFEDSFNATIQQDRQSFARAGTGDLRILNRDLDTGKRVSPGEYALADRTYAVLLTKLSAKHFDNVTAELRKNILDFYATKPGGGAPPPALATQLQALKVAGEGAQGLPGSK